MEDYDDRSNDYVRLIAHICKRLSLRPEETEQVINAVLFEIWKAWPRIRELRSWICRVTFRQALRVRNDRPKFIPLDRVAEPLAPSCSPLAPLEMMELQTALEAAIKKLTECERNVLVRRMQGRRLNQIARELGMRTTDVRRHCQNALYFLRWDLRGFE